VGNAPPNPFARLKLFCELVDSYDQLAEAFPVDQTSFVIAGPARRPTDRWARIVRAMVLRKFALASTDEVYIPTVLEAAERCLADPSLGHLVRSDRETFEKLALTVRFDEGADRTYTAPELIVDLIYGGMLHGDYEKWQQVKARADLSADLALYQFTGDVETFVRYLRRRIRSSIEQGILTPTPDESSRDATA
jgi:hypothetical protein